MNRPPGGSLSERRTGLLSERRNQRIFVVQRDDYVYLVPFVEDDKLIALKTIIPSRKATKQYLGKKPDDHET
jgi:hypothetical protein